MNVENLTKLYEVGQKILEDRRLFGFQYWWPTETECGTFCCFAGNYWQETGVERREFCGVTWHSWLTEHFGISREQSEHLFEADFSGGGNRPGPAAYAELERRMEYLGGLIREAGGMVPRDKPKREGIPDSVRAIFAERVA